MPINHPVAEQACLKCGGVIQSLVKHGYCITDIIGAALVGTPILLFIGFIFFDSGGPGARFIVLIAGSVLFGLFHMIGRKDKRILRCLKCGECNENP